MQDAFNAQMELIISAKEEGKLEVQSGFYTEAAMKSELKFSKQLICINMGTTYEDPIRRAYPS